MNFSEPEKLGNLRIGKNFIDLEVIEATNNKGETVKYQYSIFIDGTRTFGFCLPDLREFDLTELLRKFKWLQ